ncbi:MAG: hypothetical protein IPL71_06335 [Anaerolineales bacterium]|uniref:hypothetical protein n=1 Tax=Candidatus Villigracilis proximus TaxID=3140683 RepID=UPI003135BA4A|nr:hypothetical protein [Anaerolineales bacterium]
MKILEIRRHSIRSNGGTPEPIGVDLARLVGQNLGPFDRVVTSTLPRAFETAIAMGFAVDEQTELLNTYGHAVEKEAPWPQSFQQYAQRCQTRRRGCKICPKAGEILRQHDEFYFRRPFRAGH